VRSGIAPFWTRLPTPFSCTTGLAGSWMSTGRGLGLPVVLGALKAHQSAVAVESDPGRGSVFRVFFPVSGEDAAGSGDPAYNVDTDHNADADVGRVTPRGARAGHLSYVGRVTPRGKNRLQPVMAAKAKAPELERGGTLLLVEDDEMMRKLAATMLTRLGFTVLAAKDGVEAVELFQHHQDEICCVLCDLTMPRRGGWETLEAVRAIRPGIPVVLARGYDEARVMAGDHSERPQAFLGKPYKFEELSDAICRALVNVNMFRT
jgi:CheY-like chemotaxis protein